MRTFVTALACGCLSASAWAQNLQVVAPAAGATWTIGTTQQIKWRAKYLGVPALVSGQVVLERNGQTVGILKPDALLVSTITIVGHGVATGGFFDFDLAWPVQASPGAGYRVRLRPQPPSSSYPEAVSGLFSIAAQTAEDQPGNQIALKPGDCALSVFRVVARPNDPAHVVIWVEVQNLRHAASAGLQLHLIKNHVEFKLDRIPEMKSRTRWHLNLVDDAPAPFHTSTYIAILSTGNPSTEPASVLDRKEAQYRRAGTVHGGP
jgi:hypothetical protein